MSNFSLAMGRVGMSIKKTSPTLALTAGVAGLCATVVLSSRATLKAQDVVVEHKKNVETTFEAFEAVRGQKDEKGEFKYSEEDFKKDQLTIWSKSAVAMLKLYGPSIILGGLSIAAIASSHKMMNARVASLSAAYQIAQSAFERYRESIQDELGIDLEKEFHTKAEASAAKVDADEEAYVDEDRSKKLKKEYEKHGATNARLFCAGTTTAWRPNLSENMIFLNAQQNYFNDKLVKTGYVFLNEVYEALGFERTSAGQVVGWVFTGDEGSKNFVDFGINQGDETTKALLNETIEPQDVFLDFNVDGVMYDCI